MVAATQAGSSAQLQVWHGSQTLSTAFPGWGATVAVAAHASTTFTATFTPRSVGNDWWVETGVTGSQAIAKVEARLDGGAWTALPKDSWGTYADSLHAPNGTQVQFRATATSGATSLSPTVAWT
jgi:hypothetical protein